MELRCCPEGKPENYTFHHWLHHSELGKLIRQLSSKETIRLKAKDNNTRKYELNGMYSCRVDNGVKNVNGKLIQSKRVLVMQEGWCAFLLRSFRLVIQFFFNVRQISQTAVG